MDEANNKQTKEGKYTACLLVTCAREENKAEGEGGLAEGVFSVEGAEKA